MFLRDYQEKLTADIYAAWNAGNRHVLAVSPTGSGKTKVKAKIFKDNPNHPAIAIAHRQELVSQISNALAEAGIYHRIIAPKPVISFCIGRHVKLFGRSYVHHAAPMAVSGIDTLIRRGEEIAQWAKDVRIWDIDEGHHVLKDNKWGKGVKLFPNAWGLGLTATPLRLDRKSLSSKQHGVYDALVIGPTVRQLIDQGYLSPFTIFAPPPSIDLSDVPTTESGEYNQDKLRAAAHRSRIVGDIVNFYLEKAPGKRGITFVVDVEEAKKTADAFNQKQVPAMAITANTPADVRTAAMDKFERGELLQLVNVDLFGEGMDVPAVEIVSKGRPSMSLGLDRQQDGRCLRPVYAPWLRDPNRATAEERRRAIAEGPKPRGIICDHVNNIERHKPLDTERVWTLENDNVGKKKKDVDEFPIKVCVACYQPFEAFFAACPHCGFKPVPAGRSLPEQVDGDLIEYSEELLARLRGEAARAVSVMDVRQVQTPADKVIRANMEIRRQTQEELRSVIALWAGIQREVYGRSDSESYRRFYHSFGIDVMSAQGLGRAEAEKLTAMIREKFT